MGGISVSGIALILPAAHNATRERVCSKFDHTP